jgi:hypothetical protein
MSWKIYLIKHLDTDMKYVGYTEVDLQKCWETHRVNPKYAVHKPLQTEGHRMTMELLEEVETRAIARDLKQQYIQSLNTAEPNGWNRQIIKPKAESVTTPKTWIKHCSSVTFSAYSPDSDSNLFCCPACQGEFTHQETTIVSHDNLAIYFWCESCHLHDAQEANPPRFEICIYQHKGWTFFKTVYYIEETK